MNENNDIETRILIAEDELIAGKSIRNTLTSLGYNVLGIVTSGEEVVRQAGKMLPDIVLMDIKLKGEVDGIEAARQIQCHFNIPVIYLTDFSDDAILQRAKLTEPFGYTIKPINGRELLTTIEMALYRHKLETRLKESEQWLNATLHSIGDAVIATDNIGQIIFINPVAEGLTGWKQADAVGRDLAEVFHVVNEISGKPIENPAMRVLQGETVGDLANHILLVNKSGTKTPIDDSIAPIRDEEGIITGVVLAFRDITKRKQAEYQKKAALEALQKSEERLNLAMSVANDGLWDWDLTTNKVYFDPRYYTMAGYEINEFPHTLEEFQKRVHPNAIEKVMKTANDHLKGKFDRFNVEFQFAHKNGTWIWIQGKGKVVAHDKDGNPTRFVGTHSDITERKQAEIRLSQKSTLLDNILRGSTEYAIVTTDLNFHITYYNPLAEQVFGYTAKEVTGKTVQEMHTKERVAPERFEKAVKNVRAHGEHRYMFTQEHEDGIHYFDSRVSGIYDAECELVGFALFIHDVTKRKQAEAEIARLATVIEQVAATIVITNLKGDIIYANPYFETSTGYTITEALNQNPRILKSGDQDDSFYKELWDTITTGNTWKGVFINKKKNGELYHEEATIFPIKNAAGEIINYAAVKQDVTARVQIESERDATLKALQESNSRLGETLAKLKETQEQMIRQERLAAVGQLSAGIAHDFRNLLTTIILYSQMSLLAPNLPPTLTYNIETIISESKKAADLIQQILDFSSSSLLQVQALNLQTIIQNTMNILQRTIPENIQVSLKTMPKDQSSEFIVQADSGRIQQMLTNLATNARDAQPHGGELRFELSHVEITPNDTPPIKNMPPGKWVYLTVTDTGVGMSEKVRNHIFEPFFTTKEVNKGTGLGLAQVYGIVRLHEGYIDVETKLAKGTTFHIYLPASDELRENNNTKEASTVPQGHGEKILLVEDDENLREAGQSILESLGYRVLTARNGQQGLIIYKTEKNIDLVIADIVMPKMGGEELVHELRKINPNLKALCITGYALEKNADELQEAGFLGVIHKPFAVDTLAQVTNRTLNANVGRWI